MPERPVVRPRVWFCCLICLATCLGSKPAPQFGLSAIVLNEIVSSCASHISLIGGHVYSYRPCYLLYGREHIRWGLTEDEGLSKRKRDLRHLPDINNTYLAVMARDFEAGKPFTCFGC